MTLYFVSLSLAFSQSKQIYPHGQFHSCSKEALLKKTPNPKLLSAISTTVTVLYIVGGRGASQLGGLLLGIPPG